MSECGIEHPTFKPLVRTILDSHFDAHFPVTAQSFGALVNEDASAIVYSDEIRFGRNCPLARKELTQIGTVFGLTEPRGMAVSNSLHPEWGA